MFFSYPQWQGQASDPSMTVPPQPTFRPTKNRGRKQQEQESFTAAAQSKTSSSDSISSDSLPSQNLDDMLKDSQLNWDQVEADSMPGTESSFFPHGTAYTYTPKDHFYSPRTFTTEQSTPWTYVASEGENPYTTPEHVDDDAGQPPAYQESETYFYRLSDFYPFVYLSPLNYVHVEHHTPMPFFQSWTDNIVDDIYRTDPAGLHIPKEHKHDRDYSRDSQRRRQTWSSQPLNSSFPMKETPRSNAKETSTPDKKPSKLGTYSFSFLSQREIFPTASLDSLRCRAKTDTTKQTTKSRPTTPLPKPFTYVKPLTLKDALSQYDEHWGILSDVDPNSSTRWTFHTIPWPQFPSPTTIESISTRKIQRFLLASDINLKVPLRKALLRFHPDKIPKLLSNVEERDRELVSQGCSTVARCLNEIKGNLQA